MPLLLFNDDVGQEDFPRCGTGVLQLCVLSGVHTSVERGLSQRVWRVHRPPRDFGDEFLYPLPLRGLTLLPLVWHI